MSQLKPASCDQCHLLFHYAIYHCGFGEQAYGYCDRCGRLSLLDGWSSKIPSGVKVGVHHPINAHVAALLSSCPCGGKFLGDAVPRCPHCRAELDAAAAAKFIEANAEGTALGWRWQRSWHGVYCIDVEGAAVRDNWRSDDAAV
jgi:hypothetical protein